MQLLLVYSQIVFLCGLTAFLNISVLFCQFSSLQKTTDPKVPGVFACTGRSSVWFSCSWCFNLIKFSTRERSFKSLQICFSTALGWTNVVYPPVFWLSSTCMSLNSVQLATQTFIFKYPDLLSPLWGQSECNLTPLDCYITLKLKCHPACMRRSRCDVPTSLLLFCSLILRGTLL